MPNLTLQVPLPGRTSLTGQILDEDPEVVKGGGGGTFATVNGLWLGT